jgi:hypothetical protein
MSKQDAFEIKCQTTRAELEAQRQYLLDQSEARSHREENEITNTIEALSQRIDYIDKVSNQYRSEDKLRAPKVFISFAGQEGYKLMETIWRDIRNIRTPDTGNAFGVETGMKGTGEPEVMRHVINKIEPCCIFLGILTAEDVLQQKDEDGNNFAPGPWVLLEAGIAIGLGLRIVFLVEEGIHRKFWFDPLGAWRHAKFEKGSETYKQGLKVAAGLILEHYRNLRKIKR